jgi:hypothetical protein
MLAHSPSQTLCSLNDGGQFTNHNEESNCMIVGHEDWFM